MRLLSRLAELVGKLDSVGTKSHTPWVADKASAALVPSSNIIENPQTSDFDALQAGDVLVSSTPGTIREVIANRPDINKLHIRIKRNTVSSRTSLPPYLRNPEDRVAMSKQDLEELKPDTIVYMLKDARGSEYVPITVHSVKKRAHHDDPVQGEYSYEDVLSYRDRTFRSIATKIIKNQKKS